MFTESNAAGAKAKCDQGTPHCLPQEAGARVGYCNWCHASRDGTRRVDVWCFTGSYQATFINAVIWNLFNLTILLWLLSRRRRTHVFGTEASNGAAFH
jgi:hypothetical protein